jgi:hypothetical protein
VQQAKLIFQDHGLKMAGPELFCAEFKSLSYVHFGLPEVSLIGMPRGQIRTL